MRAIHAAFAVAVVIVMSSAVAHASKSKVVITPIESDSGGEVQKALGAALSGDDFSIVSTKETGKAVKSLALDDEPTDKDFAKLADALSAEVVVAGKLDGAGDGKMLRIKLYVKGKKSKKFSVQFGNPKSEKFKKTMHATLIDKIGTINKSGEDEEAEPAAEPTKKKTAKKKKATEDAADEDDGASKKIAKTKKKKKGDDDTATDDSTDDEVAVKPLAKKKKKKVASDDDAPDGELEADSEEGSSLHLAPHAANKDAVRVDFGMGIAGRSLVFNSRTFTDGQGMPKAFKNAPVPTAHLTGELFPFAFQDPKGRAAGLGVWGEYDKTISLTLQSFQPATMTTIQAKAAQSHFSIGGGYRFAFNKTDVSPTVTIGINYTKSSYQIDRTAANAAMAVIDLPDTVYKAFEPQLSFRIPFASSVALIGTGKGMLITDAGQITKKEQYGQAQVLGFEANGGLDITFSNRFALRLVGSFMRVGYTFTKGSGDKANNRDGDPTTKDVFGAADQVYGGSATLGVFY